MSDLFLNPPPWPVIIALTLLAIVIFLSLAVLVALVPPRRTPMSPFLKQLIERALKTLVQVAAALPIVTELLNKSLETTSGKSTLAIVALVLSAVSSLISKQIGDKNSASLLPPPPPPA